MIFNANVAIDTNSMLEVQLSDCQIKLFDPIYLISMYVNAPELEF